MPRPPVDPAAAERRARAREQAFLKILQWGDPILRTQAAPVTAFDANLAKLADDMVALMDQADGAGLAAPQIGVLQRVFVYRPEPGAPAQAVVNPTILPNGDEVETMLEGCLSLGKARVAVEVERPLAVVLQAQDVHGEPLRLEVEGAHARVLQHEADHLDGILMLQRAAPEQRREATRALREGRSWRPPSPPEDEEELPAA